MSLRLRAPAFVELNVSEEQLRECRSFLSFKDRQVQYLIQRHKQNYRWKQNDPDTWEARLAELKEQMSRCLLFDTSSEGRCIPYTYSGLIPDLLNILNIGVLEYGFGYPEFNPVAWNIVPPPLRPYQEDAVFRCIEYKHCAISLPTGSGKSRCIQELCQRVGLNTVVMAPTKSIAGQLYRTFVESFGKKRVGMYGDGKKELGKRFTVGIAASLTRIKRGTEAWDWFSGCQVFVADEAHMCPAETLEKVCMGLVENAPYRWFYSATQTRNDGALLVLKGITGPVVLDLSLKDLVDQGYLAKPLFKMMTVCSNSSYQSDDVQAMTRVHLYQNPEVNKAAAKVANSVVRGLGHRVLILVDEVSQFPLLYPLLHHEARFAHGGLTKENRGAVPEQFWASDPNDLVKRFDVGEFPILVGTGVVSLGTDVRSPETVIFLRGGSSVIDIPQSVGRGTRKFTFPDGRVKTSFNFVDFLVNINNGVCNDSDSSGRMSPLKRHALARAAMFDKLYPGTLKWM